MAVTSIGLPSAEIAVIALTVVCVTLVMLPPLNQQLVLLLKSHTYLAAYDNMSQSQQTDIVRQIKTLDPLTVRAGGIAADPLWQVQLKLPVPCLSVRAL